MSNLKMDRRQFLQHANLAAAGAPPLIQTGLPQTGRAVQETGATIALNRMGFGPRPGDVAAFNALGGTDEARLFAYIDQQLDPGSISDTDFETRLANAGFTTLNKSLTQLWQDHVVDASCDYDCRTTPVRETERVTFLRAIYSKRQLVEVLANFWHDHFSVYGWDYRVAPVFVHYDRDVIRAHLLGNFRDMLEAVAKSPAMLYYLDNYTNEVAGPNENYARELFELHTLGAENYLGVMHQDDVPLDGQNRPIGYVDEDVYETTRCMTGWTVDDGRFSNTGQFYYNASAHDIWQKRVLSHNVNIPPNQAPEQDGQDVLDLLVEHPGTARFICRKLCRRLISDSPPESIVQAAADVFYDQRQASDQIKQVVRHILRSVEFRTTWDAKVKRPFRAIVSALRAADADINMRLDDDTSNSFFWYFNSAGQGLFRWRPPDGYPEDIAAWQSTTPLVMRWRTMNWLVDRQDGSNNYIMDLLGQTPAAVRSATALTDFWIARLLGRSMPAAERARIVEFMAQGINPDLPLPLDTDTNVQSRLRSMVGLIFLSPEFQRL